MECAEHVLEALGVEPKPVVASAARVPDDDVVLRRVEATVTPLEVIVEASGLAIEDVLERLAELEIDGLVAMQGGGYIRCSQG